MNDAIYVKIDDAINNNCAYFLSLMKNNDLHEEKIYVDVVNNLHKRKTIGHQIRKNMSISELILLFISVTNNFYHYVT